MGVLVGKKVIKYLHHNHRSDSISELFLRRPLRRNFIIYDVISCGFHGEGWVWIDYEVADASLWDIASTRNYQGLTQWIIARRAFVIIYRSLQECASFAFALVYVITRFTGWVRWYLFYLLSHYCPKYLQDEPIDGYLWCAERDVCKRLLTPIFTIFKSGFIQILRDCFVGF